MHIVSMHILLKRIKSLIMSITFIGVVVHQHPRLFCFSMENRNFAQKMIRQSWKFNELSRLFFNTSNSSLAKQNILH